MLTESEKLAGRVYLQRCEDRLADVEQRDPAFYKVPGFLAVYRHLCKERFYRSTAIKLCEIYVPSPEFAAFSVAAGRFAFLYREGRCPRCGHLARSDGRIVDAQERPPLDSSVVRESIDERQAQGRRV